MINTTVQVRRKASILATLLATATVAVLTGCGMGSVSPDGGGNGKLPPNSSIGLHGVAFGGQQPITFATIQLYQAGTTGYGQGATALINNTTGSYFLGGAPGCTSSCYTSVQTDGGGNFNITGDYTCTSGSYLYLTATGGQPLLGTTNTSIVQLTSLGLCDNVGSIKFLTVNEVTTVATAYALSGFMNGLNVGAPATNATGLKNAFGDVNTLVNTQYGQPTVSSGSATTPAAKLYALANILGNCVNSGTGSSNCTTLFGYATTVSGTQATTTLGAALNMAKYPGNNAVALLGSQGSVPAFATTYSTGTDLTLGVTYAETTGSAPSSIAIDATGNAWIANSGSTSITQVTHGGTVSNYTLTGVIPKGIAIDNSGNIWTANPATNSVTKISTGGTILATLTGNNLLTPSSLAFDANGNVWVANSTGTNAVSGFTAAGAAIGSSAVTGNYSGLGIAINPE